MKPLLSIRAFQRILILFVASFFCCVGAMAQPGNCLTFNGTSQSAALTSTSVGNFGTGEFTVEAWIRTTQSANGVSIVNKRGGSCAASSMWDFHTYNGFIQAEVAESSTTNYVAVTGTITISDGRWHHVALTRTTAGLISLYVDGVLDNTGSAASVSNISNTAAIQIANNVCNNYYAGSIDELRIWTVARTQSQLQANRFNVISASSTNLLAYYSFDATSGTTLTDQTSNAYNGSTTNSPTWSESYAMVVPTAAAATNNYAAGFIANWTAPVIGTVDNGYKLDVSTSSSFSSFVSGYNGLAVSGTSKLVTGLSASTTYYYRVRADKTSVTGQGGNSSTITAATTATLTAPGNALNFDGTDDYVSINNTLGNFGTGNFTIEAWTNTSSTASNTILAKRFANSNGNYFRLVINTSGKFAFEIDNSNSSDYSLITGNTTVNDGHWHHVAVIRSGTQLLLYVDGVSDATAVTINGTPNISNTYPCTIGTFNNAASYAEFFNGSIDELRVYNAALTQANVKADMFSTSSSVPASLQAYYNFDEGTAGGTNTGVTTLIDQSSNANNGTLTNFAVSGAASNWVESYAMVVPTASSAISITSAGFTANWTAPAVGTVDNGYRLDVSTSSTFASFVSGYNALTVSGISKAVSGLSAATTYYYRVRADKTSVTGTGGYSSTITAVTFSTDATLSALTTTAGTISPTFASATTAYTASVVNATTSVTVTPTVNQVNATIQVKVNSGSYASVTSGSASSALSLNLGSNTITILVTAQDGTTTKTYTITVTRAFLAPGNALNFDGSDDYVSVPHNSIFNNTKVTIEEWVYWTPTTSSDVSFISSKANEVLEIQTGGSANGLRIIPTTGVYLDVVNALPTNRWTHIAFVYDPGSSNAKIYVNGVNMSYTIASGSISTALANNTTAISIGRRSDNSLFFKGSIDEFRMYNAALTQANIQADMISTSSSVPGSLLAYYNFDAGIASGTNTSITSLTDQSGNNNTGTLNNMSLSGTTSNWVESYAMVVPTATTATVVTGTGFTANWTAPAIGTVDNGYFLDVSTSSTFTSFVTGYNALAVSGISKAVSGLSAATTYYYRVRADKTSVTGQGDNSSTITAVTLSNDATLSALTTTAGTIAPTFASATTAYTASVTNATTSVTVTPTVNQANATITVNGTAVTSGSASGTIALSVGSNTITVIVTAQDGTTTKTYTITVTRAFLPPGNALDFDGTDDLVTLSTAASTATNFTSSSNFTIEAWIKPSAAGGLGAVWGHKASGSSGVNGYALFYTGGASGTMYLEVNGNSLASTNSCTAGIWNHIALVYAAGTATWYINGIASGSASIVINSSSYSAVIGLMPTTFNYAFKGSIDELRVWNTARTASQLQTNMFNVISSSSTGLLAYYNFDEGTAGGTNTGVTTLIDQTSNGYNGTLANFGLSGTTSNWVESYAMVVPTATTATTITGAGFTATWTAPAIGTVTNYLLDVSTSSTFASFVTGYNALAVSGTSQAVSGLSTGTTYYYRVRADKTSVTGTGGYSSTITTTTTPSSDATLSSLTTTAGTMSPTFASATIAYTASVTNATTSVTVTPTANQTNATIQVKVNTGSYATVASGTASNALSLNTGSNIITILVTAQDGTTTKTYTITVTRAFLAPGNALNFDGTDDYVAVSWPLTYISNLTIEAWINPSAFTADQGFFTYGYDNTTIGDGINLYINTSKGLILNTAGQGIYATGYTFPTANRWYHVALTRGGGTNNVYVNGVLVFTNTATPTTPTNSRLGSHFGARPFNGSIDEFRFYNTALTATQIQSDMFTTSIAVPASLVAYYNFDAGTAGGTNTGITTLTDQSSNGYNGTLTNFALTGATSNWVGSTAWNTWTGTSSNLFTTSTNWQLGTVPTTNDNILIPTGASNLPVSVTGTQAVNIPCMQTSTSATVTGTLQIGGPIYNSGTLTATAGTIAFNGSTAQTIPASTFASNTVQNLTINNTAGVTLGGALNVTGIFTPTAGTFTTGGYLTLKSSSITSTAMVGQVGGTVSGNVTLERYLPGFQRSFRFLSPGVTTATSIHANWQEGATAATGAGSNPNPGYGTHITGATVDQTNGFDATATGNPSLFTFNAVAQTWSNISNTNTNVLTAGQAYRMLIRGDRTTNLTTNTPAITTTTLRATGVLTTGTVTLNTASTPALSGTTSNYSFIGNPYWAPVDWNAMSKSNIGTTYYLWDPTRAGTNNRGAYVSYTTSSGGSGGAINQYIQPGQSVFIQTTGASPSLVFTEANKAVSSSNLSTTFRTANSNIEGRLQVNLYLADNYATKAVADGAAIVFSEDFSKNVGNEDAIKFINPDESISISTNGKLLGVNGIPLPNDKDTVWLSVQNILGSKYILEVSGQGFNTVGLDAYLFDKYLSTITKINLSDSISIAYDIDNNVASSASDRFAIVFSKTAAIALNTGLHVTASPNPAMNILHINFTGTDDRQLTTLRIVASNGAIIKTIDMGKVQSGSQDINVKALAAGIYTVQLQNGTSKQAQSIIKQ